MKFCGMGIRNIVILWIVLAGITLMMKSVFNKVKIEGVTQMVNAL